MKNANNYLQDAINGAHADFANADGRFSEDMYFSGDDGNFFNTNGGGGAPSAPTSRPYIILVTSASAAAVSNFDVLGTYEYLNGPTGTWSNGSLTIGSVTISSGIPGVTYQQMLQQFANSPFSVGLTYYQSATANQVLQTISIVTKDANGSIAQVPMVPTLDPYQELSTIVPLWDGYRIDGYTKLTIASVLANATIQLNLYPSDNINIARSLDGSNAARRFSNPGIIKAQPVKMIG